MGQFNLLDYWLKDVKPQKPSRRILGLLLRFGYKEKFRMYEHNTNVPIHPTLISSTIVDYCKRLSSSDGGTFNQWDKIWGLRDFTTQPLHWQILNAHIITEMCYNLKTE